MPNRSTLTVILALLALTVALAPPAVSQDGPPAVSMEVLSDRHGPVSTIEMAVRMSEATPGTATTVVIGRDDVFADALASGPLQQQGPLLLVPMAGPVPDRVRREIARVGATSAVILGGEAAIGPEVAAELAEMGLTVSRLAGASRLATATVIAQTAAPTATEAILVRAFPSEGAAQSQAFADSLGAGALAATAGIPILLTQSDVLSQPTADYLSTSSVQTVHIVGGTAAVSAEVEAAVRDLGMTTERIAGASRFATGVAVAEMTQSRLGGTLERIVLASAEGDDAWAAGFAAARHAAVTGGVVVFARDPGEGLPYAPPGQLYSEPTALPQETLDFLTGPAFAGGDGLLEAATCSARPAACSALRDPLGLPDEPRYTIEPANFGLCAPVCDQNGVVSDGTEVVLGVPPGEPEPTIQTTCGPLDGTTVTIADISSGGCWITASAPGAAYEERVAYVAEGTLEEIQNGTFQVDLPQPTLVTADPTTGAATGMDTQRGFVVSDDGGTIAWSYQGSCDGTRSDPIQVHVCVQQGDQRIQLGLGTDGEYLPSPTHAYAISPGGETVVWRGPPGGAVHDQTPGGTSCCLYATDLDDGATEVVSLDVNEEDLRGLPDEDGVEVFDGGNQVAFHGRGGTEPGQASVSATFVRSRDGSRTTVVRDLNGNPLDLGATVEILGLDEARGQLFVGTTSGYLQIDLDSGEIQPLDITPMDVPSDLAVTAEQYSTAPGEGRLLVSGRFDGNVDGQQLQPASTYTIAVQHDDVGNADLIQGVAENVLGGRVENARAGVIAPSGGFAVFNAPSSATPAQKVNAGFPRTGCALWVHDLGSGVTARVDPPDVNGSYTQTCYEQNWVGDDGTTCWTTDAALVPEDSNTLPDIYCAEELNATTLSLSFGEVLVL